MEKVARRAVQGDFVASVNNILKQILFAILNPRQLIILNQT